MKRILCKDCGRNLTNLETALNLKIRGRAASVFFCFSCLAEREDCCEEELIRLAGYFRDSGCELFARVYVDEQGSESI